MILIVGGLGFIGSHTTRALLDLGHRCVAAQRRSEDVPEILRGEVGGRLVVAPLDVRDRRATLALGEAHAITSIVFLAGAWPTNPVDELRDGAAGLANIVEAALLWKVGRVSIASTLGVYGRVLGGGSVKEETLVPHTGSGHPIPAAKKLAEIFAEQVAERSGLACIALRIAAIYGPQNRGRRSFPAALAHALAQGLPMDLTTLAWGASPDDGFDHCYVKDCGRAIALLQTVPSLRHRTYNVGSGVGTRNRDFVAAARTVAPEADLGLPRSFDEAPSHVAAPSLDITRLREDTGYAPSFDTTAGLRDYVAWLRAGNAW